MSPKSPMSRRSFLAGSTAAGGLAVLGAAGGLSGCSSGADSSSTSTHNPSGSSKPGVNTATARKGGAITIGTLAEVNGLNPATARWDTNGILYGTVGGGGAGYPNCPGTCGGVVFSLDMGLGPFVKTLPTSGKVNAKVKILGTDLIGATSVTFNGTAATFKVASGSEITTTVPEGATTGVVKVVTAGGTTLTSNTVFQVP